MFVTCKLITIYNILYFSYPLNKIKPSTTNVNGIQVKAVPFILLKVVSFILNKGWKQVPSVVII